MKTFIWADHNEPFSEYQFFVAHAEDVDGARAVIKNQLRCDYEAKVKELHDEKEEHPYRDSSEYLIMFKGWLDDAKEEYERNTSSIDKHEPTHIISAGMGMRIYHANY